MTTINTNHSNATKLWKIRVKKNLVNKTDDTVVSPGLIIGFSETNNYYDLEIRYDSNSMISYMNRFFHLCKIAEQKYNIKTFDLMQMYNSNNTTKEITESMAAFTHTSIYLNSRLYNKNVLCFVVADGQSPKTGIIFSLKTNWRVISIDPIMKKEWTEKKIVDNLTCYNNLVEDVLDGILDENKDVEQIVVVNVHSHANTNMVWKNITNWKNSFDDKKDLLCLSMPCCPGYEHIVKNVKPIYDGIDNGIVSSKNRICLWKSE